MLDKYEWSTKKINGPQPQDLYDHATPSLPYKYIKYSKIDVRDFFI